MWEVPGDQLTLWAIWRPDSTVIRKRRKVGPCWKCQRNINVGERYLDLSTFRFSQRWEHVHLCSDCALSPVTAPQRRWLKRGRRDATWHPPLP